MRYLRFKEGKSLAPNETELVYVTQVYALNHKKPPKHIRHGMKRLEVWLACFYSRFPTQPRDAGAIIRTECVPTNTPYDRSKQASSGLTGHKRNLFCISKKDTIQKGYTYIE